MSTECPTGATIIPDEGPFEPGDVLTCSADGYNVIYTWTGVLNAVPIDTYTGSSYTLQAGDFQVFCTATVGELVCTENAQDSVEGTAVGKCQIYAICCVIVLMLMALSVSNLDYV